MYKLRRSRPVKTVCFLLGCIFLALFTLNACIGALAVSTDHLDLFDPEDFSAYYEKMIFDDLANSKSWDIRSAGAVRCAAENDAAGFFEQNRSLRQGKTNFAFTVTDAAGNVLLQNFEPEKTLGSYTATAAVAYYEDGDTVYTDYDTDVHWLEEEHTTVGAREETVNAPQEESSTYTEQSSAAPEITETTAGNTAPTAQTPEAKTTEAAETTAAEEPTAAVSEPDTSAAPNAGRVNNNPADPEWEEVFIQDDTAQGYKSIMMYIYPIDDGIDQAILTHCVELYHKSFEPTEAQYYLRGAYEVYHQTDFAVSSNGNAYFVGVERSTPTTSEYYSEPRPAPKEVKYYTVTVSVDAGLQAKDFAFYAAKAMGFARGYLAHFKGLTVLFGIAALCLTVFSLCLAGYVKGEDAPVARGFHRVPTELPFLVFIGAAVCFAVLLVNDLWGFGFGVSRGGDAEMLLVTTVLLPLLAALGFGCVYEFAVKLKSRTAASSLLLVRLVKWTVSMVKDASKALNVLWKLGIFFVAGGIVTAILLVSFYEEPEILLALYIVFKLFQLAFLILLGMNLHTLQQGAKALSEGGRAPVRSRWLYGEFKKHAGYLNSIGDGINAAVEERLKSENTKTELITNVSHDLKTPLTSIVNYIDLLGKEQIDNPKAQEYIEVIDRQSQRLKKLTTDIVDASKAAAGSVNMQPERTDLTVLLGQVKGEYAEKLEKARLTLVDSLPDRPVPVYADGRLLWRVFDNLMNNVCKYSLPDTRVYLTLTAENGTAGAVFRNISASPLPMQGSDLTERFVRGDASRNTEGSGLGLYIAKSLCETMGGTLRADVDGDLFKVTVQFREMKNEK